MIRVPLPIYEIRVPFAIRLIRVPLAIRVPSATLAPVHARTSPANDTQSEVPVKARLLVAACLVSILGSVQLAAQQPPAAPAGRGRGGRGAQDTLVSPEVHGDRRVTFRIRAPQATTVTLTGDWLATPASATGGVLPMTKDDAGIWSVTSEPLEATVHLYFFTVDGMTIADPINPRIKLRTRTSASLVEVPGTPTPPWQVRDIAHGSVDWNVHRSASYNDTHEFLVYLPPGYSRARRATRCCISCTAPATRRLDGRPPARRT